MNDLTLPIPPAGYPGFQPVFDFDFKDSPARGLQLVQSIVLSIYNAWKDTANMPLAQPQVTRARPFAQFKFSTWPLLPNRLTPQKIGLTYCWMLYSILQLDRWPGHARAVISEQRRDEQQKQQIGVIDVDNDLSVREPVSASPGANVTGELSIPEFQEAQRWARCFLTTLQLPIVHSPAQRVTDDPTFSPRPGVQKHSFPCRTAGVADRLDLFIYPAANAGSPHELTWEGMIRSLITWNTRYAAGQEGGRSTQIVRNGVLIAEISVYLQPGVGGDKAVTAAA